MSNETEIAKKIIKEEVKKSGFSVKKIILFGSRARGDFRKDSDWDFFVIVDRKMPFSLMKRVIGCIQIKLAEKKIPNDVVLRSLGEFEKAKKTIGNISFYVKDEGTPI